MSYRQLPNPASEAEPTNTVKKRTVVLKDSSIQVDEQPREMPMKRQEQGINLVLSQPVGMDGLDPLSKLPINNIYYSMYDPRVLKPKKLRKKNNNTEEQKNRTGLDFNVEDEDKYEKSFYANLMKKRPMLNELIKNAEVTSANKKTVFKPEINYPHRQPEEISKVPTVPVVPETMPQKQNLIKPAQDAGQKLSDKKPSIVPQEKPNMFNNSEDMFKKPVINQAQPQVAETKPDESKGLDSGRLNNESTDVKKPETGGLFGQQDQKPLFNQTNSLFNNKVEEKPKQVEQPKPVIGNSLFGNAPATSLLFNNSAKKPEESPKEENKAS